MPARVEEGSPSASSCSCSPSLGEALEESLEEVAAGLAVEVGGGGCDGCCCGGDDPVGAGVGWLPVRSWMGRGVGVSLVRSLMTYERE